MLELVAMVEESENPNRRIKIIPVFYSISRNTCRDPKVQDEWMTQHWEKWEEEDKRRIDLGKWKSALRIFGSTTGLEMKVGMLDGELRAEVVEAVCKEVLPEMRWDDSKVEGRKRLCQEILRAVYKGLEPKDLKGGVRKVGLYGVGGIGKTTACKILCNKLCGKHYIRVCHAKLGSQVSELDLLRKVLGAFSDLDAEILVGISEVGVGCGYLKTRLVKERVFLAIDNVTDESREQAKSYLEANLGDGSVVLVTARSMDQLVRLGVKKEDCFAMPELKLEEAKSLFLSHAGVEKNELDQVFVKTCVERCYFHKGQSSSSTSSQGDGYHYHPLALEVLGSEVGEEIRLHGATRQAALLQRIESFNLSRQKEHPVFTILRSSFDSLLEEDQLLFLLVAGHLSDIFAFKFFSGKDGIGELEWLRMVHGEKETGSIEWRLEVLKRKSLLQSFGKYAKDFSMHDLWREFAAAEMKEGKLRDRCLFENVGRYNGKVDLRGFPLMRVVRLSSWGGGIALDVSGLKQLKSLEVVYDWEYFKVEVKGLGTLESLTYLHCEGVASNACIAELGLLINLQVVQLVSFDGDTLPDMSTLTNLRVLKLEYSRFLKSINLRNLTNLANLEVSTCDSLQRISVLNLTNLAKFRVDGCDKLLSVDASGCRLMTKLKFWEPCPALEELNVSSCALLPSLGDSYALLNLRKLDITGCSSLQELEDLSELCLLEELRAMHCDRLALPSRCWFPKLRVLEIEPEKVPAGFSDVDGCRS